MPGFDRTGPFGTGPMTGGARGLCNPAAAGYNTRFFGGAGYGRGMGIGRGFMRGAGRGRGPWCGAAYPTRFDGNVNEADEMAVLKSQADYLKQSLETIQKRLADLEQSSG